MHLIRVGGDTFSLRHLISVIHAGGKHDPGDIPAGGSRVTFERGPVYDLDSQDTELIDRHVERVLIPDPAEQPGGEGVGATQLDPNTGLPLTARRSRREGG